MNARRACEMQGCNATATRYGGFAGAGDWAGYVCPAHGAKLAWSEMLDDPALRRIEQTETALLIARAAFAQRQTFDTYEAVDAAVRAAAAARLSATLKVVDVVWVAS